MSQDITLAQFRRWLSLFAEQVQEQVDLLTELDAAIGDADHGANMQRGMRKVQERLQDPTATGGDIGSLFRSIAMTLISTVGGAAGPLFGAFFLRAAKDVDGTDAVSLEQLAAMFRSGLEGVQQRGKAQIEEKTMIDALQPAVEALEAAVAEGLDAAAALDRALEAARRGMLHTAELQASKGRASYLGPRSIGHQDPGATSAFYLIQSAAAALGRQAQAEES
ncbi:MAG: dihydroxyacetone kinase subunit DhaL [Chloroflexota bacterium]|nr:dihydroxyacetone kinase subunit DhaL [Chloroflexota bacterium]